MEKIRTFFKNNSWIWIVAVVFIAYFGDLYLQRLNAPRTTPTPTPVSKIASYKDLVPGIGTEADLTDILGDPISKKTEGGKTTLEYKSTNVYRNNIAVTQNGKVVLIKEMINDVDKKDISSVTAVYGEPPYTLYSSSPNSAFQLYVYPANGIAFLGHTDGTLLEVWYFQPTSIGNFISLWGQNYSTQSSKELIY